MGMRLKLTSSYRETRISGLMIVGSILSGGFLVLDENGEGLIAKVKNNEEFDEAALSDNLKEMVEAGKEIGIFLDYDEEEVIEDTIGQIYSAYVHVTDHCNLHCKGCYSAINERNAKPELSTEDLKKVLYKLREAGCAKLMVSGGEPFMRKDIVEILKYAKEELKYENIIMATNGTVHDKNLVAEAVKYLDVLSISIDGFCTNDCDYIRDKGAFAKADEFIDTAKSVGANVRLLPTLHRYNYKKIPEYEKYAEEKGIPLGFSLLTCNKDDIELSEYVLSIEEMIELTTEAKDETLAAIEDTSFDLESLYFNNSCGAGRGFISVASDGNVYPCHMLQDERYKLGNILKEELRDILSCKTAEDFRAINADTNTKCKECKYAYFCGGGCKARQLFQDDKTVDMYCESYKHNYKKLDAAIAALAP